MTQVEFLWLIVATWIATGTALLAFAPRSRPAQVDDALAKEDGPARHAHMRLFDYIDIPETFNSREGRAYVMGYDDGAAVAFGLIGMATAIRKNYFHGCPRCYKYMASCFWFDGRKFGYKYLCNKCYDIEKKLHEEREHPYR